MRLPHTTLDVGRGVCEGGGGVEGGGGWGGGGWEEGGYSHSNGFGEGESHASRKKTKVSITGALFFLSF